MASERKILTAAIKSREAFEKVESFIQPESDLTEQGTLIWKHIGEYYSRDRTCKAVDIEILSNRVISSVGSNNHREAFRLLIDSLGKETASPENVVHDFLSLRKEGIGARLATALIAGDQDDARKLLEEYNKWDVEVTPIESSSEVMVAPSLEALSKSYGESELIKLWPTSLNNRLDGGLLRGHHVVVFARPEMGKTLFLINAVAGFLAQGLVVLYVGNEDPIQDIVLRVVSRLTKRDKFGVLANPKDAYTVALANGYGNLVLAGLAPGTPKEIEVLIEKHHPDVLLIDQLRNLAVGAAGGKDGNYTQQLEKAATAARNIGKKHSVLVLSVTQAGDSASGKAVLNMGDVDSSNTGIPAQADVMVGIGATQEDELVGRRIISLPKNKRSGKHEFFPVRIDPQLSRIINLEGQDNG